MSELSAVLEELQISQRQLATAIESGDSELVAELIDARAPLLERVGAAMAAGAGELRTTWRQGLRQLLSGEAKLQEQLQQGLCELGASVRELGNRRQVLRRYRLPLKPNPRFLDRSG